MALEDSLSRLSMCYRGLLVDAVSGSPADETWMRWPLTQCICMDLSGVDDVVFLISLYFEQQQMTEAERGGNQCAFLFKRNVN